MYVRVSTFDTLRKKSCSIGPGLCGTSENSDKAKFAFLEFCELRLLGILRSSL